MRKFLVNVIVALFAIGAFQIGLIAAPGSIGPLHPGLVVTPAYASPTCYQQDVNIPEPGSNDIHHWLGYCFYGALAGGFSYYSGMDDRWSWGGAFHTISYEYLHLRAWICGGNPWRDMTNTLYNSSQTNALNTGKTGNTWCNQQADSYAHFIQNGVFDYANYFRY